MSDQETLNLAAARRYLEALEDGDAAATSALFAPEIVQIEYPNRLKPDGHRRDRMAMAADAQKGLMILRSQTYEVRNAICEGGRVSLEVFWRGVLAVELGELKPGDEMTAYSAIFLDFKDGKIVGQRNYDCFPPF
jgi:ketosteroid isomerase-like protein